LLIPFLSVLSLSGLVQDDDDDDYIEDGSDYIEGGKLHVEHGIEPGRLAVDGDIDSAEDWSDDHQQYDRRRSEPDQHGGGDSVGFSDDNESFGSDGGGKPKAKESDTSSDDDGLVDVASLPVANGHENRSCDDYSGDFDDVCAMDNSSEESNNSDDADCSDYDDDKVPRERTLAPKALFRTNHTDATAASEPPVDYVAFDGSEEAAASPALVGSDEEDEIEEAPVEIEDTAVVHPGDPPALDNAAVARSLQRRLPAEHEEDAATAHSTDSCQFRLRQRRRRPDRRHSLGPSDFKELGFSPGAGGEEEQEPAAEKQLRFEADIVSPQDRPTRLWKHKVPVAEKLAKKQLTYSNAHASANRAALSPKKKLGHHIDFPNETPESEKALYDSPLWYGSELTLGGELKTARQRMSTLAHEAKSPNTAVAGWQKTYPAVPLPERTHASVCAPRHSVGGSRDYLGTPVRGRGEQNDCSSNQDHQGTPVRGQGEQNECGGSHDHRGTPVRGRSAKKWRKVSYPGNPSPLTVHSKHLSPVFCHFCCYY